MKEVKTENKFIDNFKTIINDNIIIFSVFISLIIAITPFFILFQKNFMILTDEIIINTYNTEIIDKYVTDEVFKVVVHDENNNNRMKLGISENDYIKYDVGDNIDVEIIKYQNKILKSYDKIQYRIKDE